MMEKVKSMAVQIFSIFECHHRRTTFPQTTRRECHVTCLSCGREFRYDWLRMEIGAEIRRDAVVCESGQLPEVGHYAAPEVQL